MDIQPPEKPRPYDLKLILLEEGGRFLNDQGMKIPQASTWLDVAGDRNLNLVKPSGEK